MDGYVALWMFFLYGFLGVLFETLYCTLWMNRGTLDLRMALLYFPVNPLYGGAGVLLSLALNPLSPWPLLVFLVGLVICTGFEYLVGAALERTLGVVLWDYRTKPFNLHGRICAESAIVWGLASMLLIYLFDPVYVGVISEIPRSTGQVTLVILLALTAVSSALTVAMFRDIRRRVTALEVVGPRDDVRDTPSIGTRLIRRLAPDPILFGTFSQANLLVRYRQLQSRRASSPELITTPRDQRPYGTRAARGTVDVCVLRARDERTKKMSIATPVRSDHDIQTAVQDELEWTPDVDAAGIGVAVEAGTVSLSGEVDDNSERPAAKRAALRVRGVTTVVDDLVVHPRSGVTVTETDIAKEVERALNWASNVPSTVKATVKDHAVTLTGEVTWEFQRQAAKRAVQYLRGVHSVANMITLAARPSAADAEERIKNALTRYALLDANAIDATVSGNKVTLTGTVRSWAEKQQAGNAAWASPHVTDVDNRLLVRAY